MDELNKIKILLSIQEADTKQDQVILLLLEQAEDIILNYCNKTALPASLNQTKIRIALALYNQRGLEGLTGESFGGVSTTPADILSPDIKETLKRHRNTVKAYAPRPR